MNGVVVLTKDKMTDWMNRLDDTIHNYELEHWQDREAFNEFWRVLIEMKTVRDAS
jgi:hypothetical protein